MSLILDALRRSEQEQQQVGGVPGLATEHYAQAAPERQWLRWLPWAGLLLALTAVLWLWIERGAVPATVTGDDTDPRQVEIKRAVDPVVADGSSSAKAPGAVAERAGPAPARQQPSSSQAQSSRQPATAAVQPPPRQAPESRAGMSANAVPERGNRSRAPDAAVAALYQQGPDNTAAAAQPRAAAAPAEAAVRADPEPVAAAPSRSESDLNIDQLVKAAQSELNQPRVSDHPAPFIAELSQNTKDAIPTLLYSSHSHGGGVEAFVVLNGKELRRGDNVGAGVKVEEILEDSVVLSFRGDEFRLRALNSWVNL